MIIETVKKVLSPVRSTIPANAYKGGTPLNFHLSRVLFKALIKSSDVKFLRENVYITLRPCNDLTMTTENNVMTILYNFEERGWNTRVENINQLFVIITLRNELEALIETLNVIFLRENV